MTFFKRTAVTCAAVIVTGVLAAPSFATVPERGTFDETDAFVDTEVCADWGFDVQATEHEYGTVTGFLDRHGDFVRGNAHFNYDATISANGKTIVERDTWTVFFSPNSFREVGLTVHIQGPGGIVVRDAGQVIYNADGTVAFTHGPHEQLNGVSFCPALAPQASDGRTT